MHQLPRFAPSAEACTASLVTLNFKYLHLYTQYLKELNIVLFHIVT